MPNETIYDWGQAQPGPPSARRVDPRAWIVLGLSLGLLAAVATLALLWRPLPGLAGPLGTWSAHLEHWAKLAARGLLPSWFGAEAREYARFWAALDGPERAAILWRAGAAALAACAPAFLLAPSMLSPRDGLIHLRGSRRFEGAEAVAELRARFGARAKRRPDHEIAPGVPWPGDQWTRHVLLAGGVGSGKSTAMKFLIDRVVRSGEQLLLFDPKSEFTIGWAQPQIIAPWDSRSLAWDVARDMRNVLDMRRFAAAMVRESHDPMWSNASRQLLVGLMVHLKRARADAWGWRELAELVALPQPELLCIMADCHPEAVRAVAKASVTTAGILINLSSFCAGVFDLARAWGAVPPERRVSFVEWTLGRSPHRQLILQGHGAYGELTKSYVAGIVGTVAAIVNSVEMRDDHKRKVWLIADELPQMGEIPLLRSIFEVGRSRNFRCVVACQDFSQLEEIYSAPFVKALVSMCGTLVVGQMSPGETADALCKAFGAREVERASVSSSFQGGGASSARSTTLSFSREEIALYKPSELASRLGLTPDGLGVKLILLAGGDAFELVWPHFELREEREPHVPAPWTLGIEAASAPKPSAAALVSEGGAPRAGQAAEGPGEIDERDLVGPGEWELIGGDLLVADEPDRRPAGAFGGRPSGQPSTADARGLPQAAADGLGAPRQDAMAAGPAA